MTIVAIIVGIPVSAAGPSVSEDWTSTDIGTVGAEGSAVKTAGVWAISGAGADIWGTEDSFQFLHTLAYLSDGNVVVRVNDVADTDEFAKAGLMLRGTLATDAAAVIVDVKPSHEVEFMHRPTAGAEMRYDSGVVVSLPAWLKLDWTFTSSSGAGISYSVTASTSQDGTTWTAIGQPVAITHPCCGTMEAGAIVTSHNPGVLNTAHFEGLSMLSRVRTSSDIGGPALRGSAVEHPAINGPLAVEGAGADIWGDADSFHFVHTPITSNFQFDWNIESLDNTDPFAKA